MPFVIGRYQLGHYYTFTIHEPKERKIKALPFRDRIVHQWYVEEFIKPYLVPKFIPYTFACLEGRGTHGAVEAVQKQMQKMKRNYDSFWILKCDIRKFFDSIDCHILFDIMKKYIQDKKLLDFTQMLIFSNRDYPTSQGIPIRQSYLSIFC